MGSVAVRINFFLQKLASLIKFKIQWAQNGVFRGQKLAEGSTETDGVSADTHGAKKTNKNNKNTSGVSKKTRIFDFVKKKIRMQKSVFFALRSVFLSFLAFFSAKKRYKVPKKQSVLAIYPELTQT